jgi:hypothetical protein
VLASDVALWRRRRARAGFLHRARYTLALGLAVWTYPQAIKQEYPGRPIYWADFCRGAYAA